MSFLGIEAISDPTKNERNPPKREAAKITPITKLFIDDCFHAEKHCTRAIHVCDFDGKAELLGMLEGYKAERQAVLDDMNRARDMAITGNIKAARKASDDAFERELGLFPLAAELCRALAEGYEKARAIIDEHKAGQLVDAEKVKAEVEAAAVASGAEAGSQHVKAFVQGHPRVIAEKQKTEYFRSGLRDQFEFAYPDTARSTADKMNDYRAERCAQRWS